MESNKKKVKKDKNSVNEFLYAFGLKKPESNDSMESPMDFAYAMGVTRYIGPAPEKKPETVNAPITAKLKYI